jgi:hypothetical protein
MEGRERTTRKRRRDRKKKKEKQKKKNFFFLCSDAGIFEPGTFLSRDLYKIEKKRLYVIKIFK